MLRSDGTTPQGFKGGGTVLADADVVLSEHGILNLLHVGAGNIGLQCLRRSGLTATGTERAGQQNQYEPLHNVHSAASDAAVSIGVVKESGVFPAMNQSVTGGAEAHEIRQLVGDLPVGAIAQRTPVVDIDLPPISDGSASLAGVGVSPEDSRALNVPVVSVGVNRPAAPCWMQFLFASDVYVPAVTGAIANLIAIPISLMAWNGERNSTFNTFSGRKRWFPKRMAFTARAVCAIGAQLRLSFCGLRDTAQGTSSFAQNASITSTAVLSDPAKGCSGARHIHALPADSAVRLTSAPRLPLTDLANFGAWLRAELAPPSGMEVVSALLTGDRHTLIIAANAIRRNTLWPRT